MKRVDIDLGGRSYQIVIGTGLLANSDELLPWVTGRQVCIVTNEVVAPLYLDKVTSGVPGKEVHPIILPDGEATKNLATLERILDSMLLVPLERSVTVIALGGGVIGDMAGFAAACYQRGVPFIQFPTTLLAQVDSSVGGKTAVNHPRGKNMIGAFYQPRRVLIDIDTLSTLDSRQFASGLAEVIKYGLINDAQFFEWLEKNIGKVMQQQPLALEHIIEQSCLNKARVVEQDETEKGIRALLNLGHTFGHAIETVAGYGNWLHGEAVAAGMVMAASMSRALGGLDDHQYERIHGLVAQAGLPVSPTAGITATQLKQAMKLDKKVQSGKIRLVLLKGIGDAYVEDRYDEELLDETLNQFTLGNA